MPQQRAASSTRTRNISRGRSGSFASTSRERQAAAKGGRTADDATGESSTSSELDASGSTVESGPPKSILVRNQDAAERAEADEGASEEGSYAAEASKSSSDDVEVDNHGSTLLQPLLKFLPTNIDPSTIRKLLGAVHPSAFGSYRTKEAWRKENPDVLYSAYSSRSHATANRGESCPPMLSQACLAHSPPSSINVDDYDSSEGDYGFGDGREQLDWERLSGGHSPTGSVSSLAELAQIKSGNEESPSKLAIYLSAPAEEARQQTTSTYLGRPMPPRPIRRQTSSSSLATSSSVCTCASNASNTSKSSSIRFASLPDSEDLRKHKSMKNKRSFTMGIAGRRNLLLGKTELDEADVEEDKDITSPSIEEAAFSFDDIVGENKDLNDDEYEAYQRANANDVTFRYNEEGEMVEKRPLGVTLEDLHLPMKRTKNTRGRPRKISDLSMALSPGVLSRALSSPPSLASGLPKVSFEPSNMQSSINDASSSSSSSFTSSPPHTARDHPHASQSPSHSKSSSSSSNDSSTSTAFHCDEKTPMQTPRFEKVELDFTPSATPRPRSPVQQLQILQISPITAASASTAILQSPPPHQSNLIRDGTTKASPAGDAEEEEDNSDSPELEHDLAESSSPAHSSPESPSSNSSDFEEEDKNYFSSEEDETFDGDQTIGSVSRNSAVNSGGRRRQGLAIPSLLTGICSGKPNVRGKVVKKGGVKARPPSGRSYAALRSKKAS